jgi:hypothetical protein
MFATMLGWIRKQWGCRSGALLGHLHFLFYTRRGCHLCEVAWQRLQEAQRQYGFNLEQRDIDADADLRARYGEWVPVVTVNGKERFRGGVPEVLLRRLLCAEAERIRSEV